MRFAGGELRGFWVIFYIFNEMRLGFLRNETSGELRSVGDFGLLSKSSSCFRLVLWSFRTVVFIAQGLSLLTTAPFLWGLRSEPSVCGALSKQGILNESEHVLVDQNLRRKKLSICNKLLHDYEENVVGVKEKNN